MPLDRKTTGTLGLDMAEEVLASQASIATGDECQSDNADA